MDASVKEEPSEITEEMDALYEDVMENGVEMETIEVDDSLPSTDEPSCSSRPPRATMTPIREKLVTIHVRRSLEGVVYTPIYSARSMWSQKATSRTQAAKRFTVVAPRRTPYDEHFQQRQGRNIATSAQLVQANIGTSSAPIVLDSEEEWRDLSEEQPEATRDEQSTSAKKDDATAKSAFAAKTCAKATSSLPAEAGSSPVASGAKGAPVEVDEPTAKAAEAPPDAVQVLTKESGAEMALGPSNSVAVVGPMRPLEAVLTARKAQKTLRGCTDRQRAQNRVAAHRYRRRRHEQRKKAQRGLMEAERRNTQLKAIITLLESQINLLRESFKTE